MEPMRASSEADLPTANHIVRRPENQIYEYVRRVPRSVAHLDRRPKVRHSLGTRDFSVAKARAAVVEEGLNQFWSALLQGDKAVDATDRYRAATKLAHSLGFSYRTMQEILSEANPREVLSRLDAALEHDTRGTEGAVEAITGTAEEPSPRLSDLWSLYERNRRAYLSSLSPNQYRKHETPRHRAIDYAIKVMGNKELRYISRADVIMFRDWWVDKMEREHLRADTINRSFSDLKGMITVVDETMLSHFGDVWAKVRVKSTARTKSRKWLPYDGDFICKNFLVPGRLDGLNIEARTVVYLIIETGARPSELCNLRGVDFVLDAKIPYIRVTERDDRRVKTEYSYREIPLVGCALWAAKELIKQQPAGFLRYADKEDYLSNVINAFLRQNKLRPTPRHVLYSFRHSFQDRILAAGAPDRLQTDLMGHEFDRPDYGAGASLKQKRDLLNKIKFPWPLGDVKAANEEPRAG
ncbi:site-specific integrase [Devosia sp. 67-54]|uniref:site-specific integrase n=1 Tax=unclassified Devosia TaxID=196773 RepID=UPI0026840CD7